MAFESIMEERRRHDARMLRIDSALMQLGADDPRNAIHYMDAMVGVPVAVEVDGERDEWTVASVQYGEYAMKCNHPFPHERKVPTVRVGFGSRGGRRAMYDAYRSGGGGKASRGEMVMRAFQRELDGEAVRARGPSVMLDAMDRWLDAMDGDNPGDVAGK